MPFMEYREKNFRATSLAIIDKANEIIDDYREQGYDLTLRQLYYQFVSKALIENTEQSYKRLGSIINDGRMAGLIDWEAITDRTRNLQSQLHLNDPAHAIDMIARQYGIDRWENQDCRVEVWVEKEALAGVVERVCAENDVPYFSCRGYVSQSEQWRAGQRMLDHYENGQMPQDTIVLHLGDHDPSGIDMTRDNLDRLNIFSEGNVLVKRIALNMDQIKEYNPPPNPAKLTDARAKKYIRHYGRESWELDALNPTILSVLIQKHIDYYKNEGLWAESQQRLDADLAVLYKLREESRES